MTSDGAPIKSASRYLTCPSLERASLAGDAALPDTVEIKLAATTVGGGAPRGRISARAWLLAASILVLGLIVICAIGYVVYVKFFERDQVRPFVFAGDRPARTSRASESVSEARSDGPRGGDPDRERLAKEAYESGVSHQEQAARLAEAGQKTEASAESEKAIAKYREAVALSPKLARAHENLGVALYNTGQLTSAVEEYEAAIVLAESPTSQLLTNYAYALLGLRRFREAAGAFDKALQVEPSDYDLHFYRGSVLYFAGDMESSRAAYLEYVRLAPGGQYADQARDFIAGRSVPAEINRN